jgi:hypothetical protein
VHPGGLGEDLGFFGAVAHRFERSQGLLVQIERSGPVAAKRGELAETTKREAGPFVVAETLWIVSALE